MNFTQKNINELNKFAYMKKEEYLNASPFPHIVIDNFFNEKLLDNILNEFPRNLENIGYEYQTKVEQKKFTLK